MNTRSALATITLAAACLASAPAVLAGDLSDTYDFKPVRIGGGGYVVGMAIHPDADGPIYLRTDVGGVYRREGDLWKQLITLDAMPASVLEVTEPDAGRGANRGHAYHVEAIAIDSSDPDVLLVATGRFRNAPGLLLRSDDRGETFERCRIDAMMIGNAEGRFSNERLAFQPGGTGVVLFGSRADGLFRSTDGGRSFTPVEGVPTGQERYEPFGIGPVVFDHDHPEIAMLCVDGDGTYRSEDAGRTWKKRSNTHGTDIEFSGGIAHLTGTSDGSVRRLEDGDWTDVTPPGGRVDELAVHPSNPDLLYAMTSGGQRFFRSDDGGQQWVKLRASSDSEEGRAMFRSPEIPWVTDSTVTQWLSIGDFRFDPRDPDRLWLAEGMGIWHSDALGGSDPEVGPAFNNRSMGIEETVANDVHAAPGGRVTLLIRDRAGFFRPGHAALDAYPEAQIGLTDEFTMGITVNAQGSDPLTLAAVLTDSRQPSGAMDPYGYEGDGNASGLSRDGGQTWEVFPSIDPETEFNDPRRAKFGEIAIDAGDADRLVWLPRVYIDAPPNGAEQNIFFSRDAGRSWLPAEIGDFWDRREHYLTSKRSLAADPVTPGRFYAYHFEKGTLYRSDDSGETWAEPEGAEPATGYAYHNQLRVTPGRAGDLWLATGYDLRAPETETGLYHSTDAGLTWKKIPGVDEAWAIGHGKAAPGTEVPTLFLYGRIRGVWGLYRSTDEGAGFDLLSAAPLGIFDQVTCVTGDPDVFGMVYLGWQGNGFAYGRPR